jgi:hypothetical protein
MADMETVLIVSGPHRGFVHRTEHPQGFLEIPLLPEACSYLEDRVLQPEPIHSELYLVREARLSFRRRDRLTQYVGQCKDDDRSPEEALVRYTLAHALKHPSDRSTLGADAAWNPGSTPSLAATPRTHE